MPPFNPPYTAVVDVSTGLHKTFDADNREVPESEAIAYAASIETPAE